ncbi:MAG TPA: DUF2851 family protein [Candidatus Cloacimonadota bacterium]|nr:DUF2851 family protein [Candidatus Cloacimonadota bacterium]
MKLTEKFLYHIWDAQHLLPDLKTISGNQIKILFPGRWNTDSGPDFKDAIIELNGKVMRGDVEIELSTYNWNRHEHHENPAFNHVILQVVYHHDGQYECNFNENGEPFEILQMEDFLNEDISKLIKRYTEHDTKILSKTCPLLGKMTLTEFEEIVTDYGWQRFEKKVKRFAAEHYFAGFDQLLYQGLLEALGYSKNKYEMLQLALKIPYSELKDFYDKGMTKDELIAIWLCSSDLIGHLPASFPPELKTKWQELFSQQNFFSSQIDINWQLFRIRPINHPAIRLLQIAEILYGSFGSSLFKSFLKLFSCSQDKISSKALCKTIYQYFQTIPDFLPEKYKPGKTRLDTILINIILPLVMVYAREKSFADLEKIIVQIYREYAGLPANFITRFMDGFLTAPQQNIVSRKAICQQGILKLYYDKCQYHNCEECSA